MNTVNVSNLCTQLLGQPVGTNMHGQAGRRIEDIVEQMGIVINRGRGCDIKVLGLELKSRDRDAVSPQNVATMTPQEIVETSYKDSVVYEKFQQQLRVYTKHCIIVDAAVYDFTKSGIQDLIEHAYQHGRQQITVYNEAGGDVWPSYVYGSEYGYWEQIGGSTSYTFRIHYGAFAKLERMARSTFDNLFEYA